jgi:hypothetical protein
MTRAIIGGCVGLLGAFASVPAFLIAFNPMVWLFQTSFEVVNQSGEIVYVTPVGVVEGSRRRSTLPLSFWSIPMVPRADCGNFRLYPGAKVVFRYDWDDINLSELAVRSERGTWRELVVLPDATSQPCCSGPAQEVFVIPPLDQLPVATAATEEAATATRINQRVRMFHFSYAGPLISLGGLILAGRALFRMGGRDANRAA